MTWNMGSLGVLDVILLVALVTLVHRLVCILLNYIIRKG